MKQKAKRLRKNVKDLTNMIRIKSTVLQITRYEKDSKRVLKIILYQYSNK